jgi:hypothetical protein
MKTTKCPNGCDHTDTEHEAFDRGVQDGSDGVSVNPYSSFDLREIWRTGHSVTATYDDNGNLVAQVR